MWNVLRNDLMMASPFRRSQKIAILSVSMCLGAATTAATLDSEQTVTDIVRVSYVQTSSIVGQSEKVVEQGTISIGADGGYRIDRQKNGVVSAEIVDVTANRRVMLDLEKHTALTGTMLMAPITPGPGP